MKRSFESGGRGRPAREPRPEDLPPNSRLFVVLSKTATEEMVRAAFEEFGNIENINMVLDKRTRESKGVCYVKYSKCSEACLAMENMADTKLEGATRPMRVVIAHPGGTDDSTAYDKSPENMDRLFLYLDKNNPPDEDELRAHFEQWDGTVKSVVYAKDRKFAFVAFRKCSEAAVALENCDQKYKPKFAEPRTRSLADQQRDRGGGGDGGYGKRGGSMGGMMDRGPPKRSRSTSGMGGGDGGMYMMMGGGRGMGGGMRGVGTFMGDAGLDRSMVDMPGRSMIAGVAGGRTPILPEEIFPGIDLLNNPTGCTELFLNVGCALNREQIWRLCDLIPGLLTVDVKPDTSGERTIACVHYASVYSATWAWEKLQDLEYPPGQFVRVRYAPSAAAVPPDWTVSRASSNGFGAGMDSFNGGGGESLYPSYPIKQSAMPSRGGDGFGTPGGSFMSDFGASPMSRSAMISGRSPMLMGGGPGRGSARFECSVELGPAIPLLPRETPTASRVFIIMRRQVPMEMMEHAFSTVGDLIRVYYVKGKNFGFALYATEGGATRAKALLHDQYICGEHMKVVDAEEEKPSRVNDFTEDSFDRGDSRGHNVDFRD